MNIKIAQMNVEREVCPIYSNCINVGLNDIGCGKLFSIDGNWKLTYPICTYKEAKSVSGFNGSLKYVDTCPNQPANGLDICLKHCKYVNKEESLTSSGRFK